MVGPYASLEAFKLEIGREDLDSLLPNLEPAERDGRYTKWLNAASGGLDGCATKAGYAVPMIPSSMTTNVELQARIADALEVHTIAGATMHAMRAVGDTKRWLAAQAHFQRILDDLCKGIGLPVAPPQTAGSVFAYFENNGIRGPANIAASRRKNTGFGSLAFNRGALC